MNPEVAGEAAELLGEATRTGLTSIDEQHDDVQGIEEISGDEAKRERSSWRPLAGLSEVVAKDIASVKRAVDEDTINLLLETYFEEGLEE